MTETAAQSTFAPYLPRLVRSWSEEPDGPRARTLDGSLVSVDISGFTALAEQLAVNGKAGAEELVGRISAVFDDLIGVAERHGGDVLKFRGDALLLFFGGERHVLFLTRSGLVDLEPASGKVRFEFPWRSRNDASVNAATFRSRARTIWTRPV